MDFYIFVIKQQLCCYELASSSPVRYTLKSYAMPQYMSVYITDRSRPRSLHFLLRVSIKSFCFHYRQRYCHLALIYWGSAGAHLYRKRVCDSVQPIKADLLALVLLFDLAGRTAAPALVRIYTFHLWHCSLGGRDRENAHHHILLMVDRVGWQWWICVNMSSDEYV